MLLLRVGFLGLLLALGVGGGRALLGRLLVGHRVVGGVGAVCDVVVDWGARLWDVLGGVVVERYVLSIVSGGGVGICSALFAIHSLRCLRTLSPVEGRGDMTC